MFCGIVYLPTADMLAEPSNALKRIACRRTPI